MGSIKIETPTPQSAIDAGKIIASKLPHIYNRIASYCGCGHCDELEWSVFKSYFSNQHDAALVSDCLLLKFLGVKEIEPIESGCKESAVRSINLKGESHKFVVVDGFMRLLINDELHERKFTGIEQLKGYIYRNFYNQEYSKKEEKINKMPKVATHNYAIRRAPSISRKSGNGHVRGM